MFVEALTTPPHLSLDGLFGMVYEHLLGSFIFKHPSPGFSELFQATNVVVCKDILRLVALMLAVIRLLVMAKDISGLHIIVVGKVFLQLINRSILL